MPLKNPLPSSTFTFALLLASGLAFGCADATQSASDCDRCDEADEGGLGELAITWNLQNGAAGACPEPVAWFIGINTDNIQDQFEEAFDCADGRAQTSLPFGKYHVHLKLTDTDDAGLDRTAAAISDVITIDVNSADTTLNVDYVFPTDVAFQKVSWSLSDGTNAIECPPGSAVSVSSVDSNGMVLEDIFDCAIPALEDPEAAAVENKIEYLLGAYTISAKLLDRDGETLASSSQAHTREMEIGNEVQTFPNFNFVIESQ